jgi:hypothetical protein
MYLQKVISIKTKEKLFFFAVLKLKVTDKNSRIRIHTKTSRIRNTATEYCHVQTNKIYILALYIVYSFKIILKLKSITVRHNNAYTLFL